MTEKEKKQKEISIFCFDCGCEFHDREVAAESKQEWAVFLCKACLDKARETGAIPFKPKGKDMGPQDTASKRGPIEDNNKPPKDKKGENTSRTRTGSNLPAKTSSQAPATRSSSQAYAGFTPEQIDTIRRTVAKGASDDELVMFLTVASRYELDPFMKEIFFSAKTGAIMTGRDGYLAVAKRDPKYKGIQSMAVCANDEFSVDMKEQKIDHKFGIGDRGPIIGAWAVCYHEDRFPVIAFASLAEYKQDTSNVWSKYPSAMICKVAEAFALKRQFGISGMVTKEEMGVEDAEYIDAVAEVIDDAKAV